MPKNALTTNLLLVAILVQFVAVGAQDKPQRQLDELASNGLAIAEGINKIPPRA